MTVPKHVRRKRSVLSRDKYRCQYCGERLTRDTATVDHMTPRALGGTSHLFNLVACCRGCNASKGKVSPLDFLWAYGVRFQLGTSRSRRAASRNANRRRAMG